MHPPRALAILLAALSAACASSKSGPCDPVAQAGCDAGLVCEQVTGGSPTCFEPVVVIGTVRQLGAPTPTPVAGARVVALDQDRAPLSDVATSAADGAWSLRIPAARDAQGRPVAAQVTLRADAQGHLTFPGGLRAALPLDLADPATVTHDGTNHRWTVSGPLTALELLASAGGAAWLHGTVARPAGGVGALVVAEPSPGGTGPGTGRTAIADASGAYTVFNLAAGTTYQVKAYAKGTNYTPVLTAALAAGDNAAAPLALAPGAGATFSGTLILNNGATDPVGVALVVESTYLPTLDRGETPPGLVTQSAQAGYAITGVPDGRYVALAAYGAEGAVRDVSGGGNTAAVQVEVLGNAVLGTAPSFKIRPAVALTTIDGQPVSTTPVELASATPVFTWQRGSGLGYSAAQTFRVRVYDALGVEAWSQDVDAVNNPSVTYAGAPLAHGMTYQLRIQAIDAATPVPATFDILSQSEDLLGVFVYP